MALSADQAESSVSQSNFIGPATIALLIGLWGAAYIFGAPQQALGGLALLTLLAGLMAILTLG